MQETWVWSLSWEDPLAKELAVHSSILAWAIPWTEDSGRLHTVCRVARVRYNLTTKQQQHGGSQLPLGTEPAPRALEGNPTTGTPEKKFLECFQEFHFSFSFGILSIILRIFKVVAAGNLLHNDLVGHYLASSSTAAILQTSITSHEHVLIFIIKPVYKTTKRKMANRRKWLFALTQVFTISNTLPPC